MARDYPNDSDGDALQRVVDDGNDMSLPMTVDFPVVLPDLETAQQFAALAAKRGYDTDIAERDSRSTYDVYCTKRMVLNYDSVIKVQLELNKLAGPLGGYSDGWGTFGNKDEEG
jgi:regulator of RNase E activity RraB